MLSFDRERRRLATNDSIPFRWADTKQIQIAHADLIVPFRADIFLELNAVMRERLADEVVVELAASAELPGVCETLTHRFPGGIYLGKIAQLKRSIIMMEAADLPDGFWTGEAASETDTGDPNSEGACSHAHGLARSIECSDTVVITDAMTVDPERLGRALRLVRGINPGVRTVDTRLFRFDSQSAYRRRD